jgi:hypothetical protein
MQIMTRQEAIRLQQSRYFTNEACKRGHVVFRYTKNGGCSLCINPKFEALDIAQREKDKLRAAEIRRLQMIPYGFPLAPKDLESFTLTILMFAQSHEPTMQRRNVIGKRGWVYAGDGLQLRQFWIFREDREALVAIASYLNPSAAPDPVPPSPSSTCAHKWGEVTDEPGALRCVRCGYQHEPAQKTEADLEMVLRGEA